MVSSERRFGEGDVTDPLPGGRRSQSRVRSIGSMSRRRHVVRHRLQDRQQPTAPRSPTPIPPRRAPASSCPPTPRRNWRSPGQADAMVRAEYSFFAAGKYERVGYTFTPEIWAQVARSLGHVVDGIESGLYRRPGTALVAVVGAVRVLRTRRARHRRALGRVGPQAPRSTVAALVRRPRGRAESRRRGPE